MNFREKVARFMVGRYGQDQFNKFLMGCCGVCLILSLFRVPYVYYAGLLFLVYAYFRMLSRNYYKRQKENGIYLKATYKIRTKWGQIRREMQQRKTHHIYRCPDCKQKIRVPRGRGKIEIRCPKCNCKFIKNS